MHARDYASFLRHYRSAQYGDAVVVGSGLLAMNPADKVLRMRVANAMRSLNQEKESELIWNAGLDHDMLQTVRKIVPEIRNDITDSVRDADLWSIVPVGAGPYCIIDHGGGWITKVVDIARNCQEVKIYRALDDRLSDLRAITPVLRDYRENESGTIGFLTIEKIDGESPVVDDSQVLVRAYARIREIAYNDVVGLIPKPNLLYQLAKIRISFFLTGSILVKETFCWIHRQDVNRWLFRAVRSRVRRKDYRRETVDVFRRLERVIMDSRIFERIIPAQHYRLIHGDLHRGNIIVDAAGKTIKIIDWEQCGVGPSGADLATYLNTDHSFQVIDKLCLSSDPAAGIRLTMIEQVVFVYCLLISWLNRMRPQELADKHDEFLRPAIERLEQLVSGLGIGHLRVS